MNILMMTNTYVPLVGGLERSVKSFVTAFRRRGHRVLVVTPAFEGAPRNEEDVIRIPAIQHFNGSAFSVKLPTPRPITRALTTFKPQIIHTPHPFLVGSTAFRLAHTLKTPLIFTYHTRFDQYTHMLPVHTPAMGRFVVELSVGYANLCDRVFAPSESVARMLRSKGVTTPIDVVPTGIDLRPFAGLDRAKARPAWHIPKDAFVVGHVGRLSPEKNLVFLAQVVTRFLKSHESARFLVIGEGPSERDLLAACREAGVVGRLISAGVLRGRALVEAYAAMDVFAFASKSETQGLVVTEAMAARAPVVALNAPGVREVVEDKINGRLLPSQDAAQFSAALAWVAGRSGPETDALRKAAWATAERFSLPLCADHALARYADVLKERRRARRQSASRWASALRRVGAEWHLLTNLTKATAVAVKPSR